MDTCQNTVRPAHLGLCQNRCETVMDADAKTCGPLTPQTMAWAEISQPPSV